MLFKFKDTPQDFLVSEELGFKLSENGDCLYVFFEKINTNTMDIVEGLCKRFNIQRKNIGISGLKDKVGVTRQRISVYKSILNKAGGKDIFLAELAKYGTILEEHRHENPLSVGKNLGNNFTITLRARKESSNETKQEIEKKISEISKTGFPNCFGKQRFGKGSRNFKRVKEIFEGEKVLKKDDFENKFKLQAYPSMYFNNYCLSRRNKGQHLLQGDILVDKYNGFGAKVGVYSDQKVHMFDYKKCKENFVDKDVFSPDFLLSKEIPFDQDKWFPTGPMLGTNLLIPEHNSKARFRDRDLIQKTDFLTKGTEISKEYNIYGFRRPLKVIPQNVKFERLDNDLQISFFLPTGCFATVFLGFIFKDIDQKTCNDNNWEIPNTLE